MELKIIPGRVAKIIIMYTVEEDVGAIAAGGGIAASVHLIHLNRTKTTKPKRSPIILGLGERPIYVSRGRAEQKKNSSWGHMSKHRFKIKTQVDTPLRLPAHLDYTNN